MIVPNLKSIAWIFVALAIVCLAIGYPNISHAAAPTAAPSEYLDPYGVFDKVVQKYQDAGAVWANTLLPHAQQLFWILASLSLVWTLGTMILRQSDIGEIVAELMKFIMFTGFFYALLLMSSNAVYGLSSNAPNAILDSFLTLGMQATNSTEGFSPSGIVDAGFNLVHSTVKAIEFTSPESWIAVVCAILITMLLALIAINVLIVFVQFYMLAYVGVFLLGFGGSKWTSDMALNYYRKLLEMGIQLLTTVLLVSLGKVMVMDIFTVVEGVPFVDTLVSAIVTTMVLYKLVDTAPAAVSSIVTGFAIGQLGTFSSGAVRSAASLAGGAIGSTASWGNKQSQNLMGTSAEKLKATASAIASGDPKAKMPSKLKMALSTKNIDDLAVAGSAKALGAAVKGGAHGSVLAAKATAGIAKGGLHAAREVKSFGEVMGTVGGFTREGLGGVTKT